MFRLRPARLTVTNQTTPQPVRYINLLLCPFTPNLKSTGRAFSTERATGRLLDLGFGLLDLFAVWIRVKHNIVHVLLFIII